MKLPASIKCCGLGKVLIMYGKMGVKSESMELVHMRELGKRYC